MESIGGYAIQITTSLDFDATIARATECLKEVASVFLPCNVVVWDEGDRRVAAAMEPKIMANVIDHSGLAKIAEEVSARFHRVMSKLEQAVGDAN